MRFQWPEGAKCAVALSFEYDAESVEYGFKKHYSGSSDWGGFAPRFGIPRMLELLDNYGIKGTFFVPGWDAERYPESVRDIARAGHEVAAHGYIHEDFSRLSEKEEREVFDKAHNILTEITGTPPRGFRSGAYWKPLSPNTLRFLRDMGYCYDSSYLDDDEPYAIKIEGEEPGVIEIPWAWVLNDLIYISVPFSSGIGLVLPTRTSQWILEIWKEEFDSLYEKVGFFNLVVHPTHMGAGCRMPLMEGMIRFIRGYADIWVATYGEIADLCLKQIREGLVHGSSSSADRIF